MAVHLRFGGLTGEEGIPGVERGLSPLPNFVAGLRCAKQLATSHHLDLSRQHVLIVTDNHHLRKGLQDKLVSNVVAPGGLPVHLDRAHNQSLQAHQKTIVDLVLLGWAECLVTSRSGFSLQAFLYGGAKPCSVQFTKCL